MVFTATAATLLDAEAFNQLVLERGLTPWMTQQYIYAGYRGANGWELYRTPRKPRYYYVARRVATQANAAGGAIKVDIAPATGQALEIVGMRLYNSGTNGLAAYVNDEDDNPRSLAVIAQAAGLSLNLPTIGTAANATGNLPHSIGLRVVQGEKLSAEQTAAGAQNDTLTVSVVLELIGSTTAPTWSVARSTNFANVTLAASTISDANTLVQVNDTCP